MPDRFGVCAFDGTGRLRYVSRTVGGFDADEILGSPVWMGSTDERHVRAAFAECLMTGTAVAVESRTIGPDGETYAFRYVFYPLPESTRVVGVWFEPTSWTLDEAEIEALTWLSKGLRINEVAGRMLVSESTVKAALFRARSKLGARTNTEAVALAVRAGAV